MHKRKVVHRDLKPENILFSSHDQDAEVKIIDFGLSNKFSANSQVLHTQVGTPIYVSPEVLKGVYNEMCDVWSLGVILYVLLCGYPPFFGQNRGEIFYEIQNTEPDL